MYKTEDYSVKNQRNSKSFRLESNSYAKYLPTGVASGVNIPIKFHENETKKHFLMICAGSISITFLIYQQ